ncbi:MAG: cytochrome ubiquinol oxidase subunit I, partial [Bacteroidota bacterium]
GFLGILLFGWNRVSPAVHFFSTLMVALGSMFSAVWIVVANSWQQTPAGYHIVGEGMKARAEIMDFWAMVFNPSSVDRLSHVIIGAFLAGAFLVMSVHAYYLVRGRHIEISKRAFKIALGVAMLASIAQLLTGHRSAEGVAVNQPAKLAAFEGHFAEKAPGDLYLLGWVDKESQTVHGIYLPGGLSYLLYQDFEQAVTGLNAFPETDRPSQVNAVFQFYHLMVAIGMFLIAISFLAGILWWRGILFSQTWLLKIFVPAVLLPQLANQFGWYAAEMGRQPWVVYGLLRTSDALSKAVKAEQILFSLILFTLVYMLLFSLFIYMLNKKIQKGFGEEKADPIPTYSKRNNPILN